MTTLCSRSFTETNIDDITIKHIGVLDDWKDIHNNVQHGLGLCYKVSKTNITEVIDILSITEILPIVLEIKKIYFLFVIVYFVPGPVSFFIDK